VGISDIIVGKRSAKELGGPIMIASVASEAANNGLASYLFIMAIISINLGLINLFPIPLLDGGHLLLYGIQAVTRSNINNVLLKYYYAIGMFILLALMIFVNYNDLIKQLN
jgi:regulator of sigma E protease